MIQILRYYYKFNNICSIFRYGMRTFFISIFILLLMTRLDAQQIITKGVPNIKSFKNQHDKLYSHTWAIDEAPNGILYFVNDKGLLEFDGSHWKIYKGSEGITRSIKVADNKLIYTGSDNDFGVWKLNENNEFVYKSLYKTIPNKAQVEEFWDVFKLGETIVFRSFTNLYMYQGEQLTIIKAPQKFIAADQSGNSIWLIDEKDGLLEFDGHQLKTIKINQNIDYSQVVALDAHDNDVRLITKTNGIFSLKSNQFISYHSFPNFPSNDVIFCYQRIGDKYHAFGSIQHGVLIVNQQGVLVHGINKTKGLQNNTILSMHYSKKNGYLWLGLDYGIDALHLNTPVSYMIDYQGTIGTTYTAYSTNNSLYLGTNQGLYSTSLESLNNHNYQLLSNSQGQVWTIHKLGESLLVGHDKGLYRLDGNQLRQLDNKNGVMTIMPFGNYFLTGNYEGVYVYQMNGNQVSLVKKIPKLVGTFKQLIGYQNKIFAQLPNVGVLEFVLDTQFNIIKKTLYEKTLFGDKPFQISIERDRLNIYTIDSVFSKSLSSNGTQFASTKYEQNTSLKKNLLQDNFLPIYNNDKYQLYSIYNGFSIKSLEPNAIQTMDKSTIPLIRQVASFDNFDKVNIAAGANVLYKMNNISIQYILPSLYEDAEYQYSLNSSKEWSSWSDKTSVEFLNLKEGNYTFRVRAKCFGQITPISQFEFYVKPPFYRSWWAYLFYLGMIILGIYLVRKYNEQKLNKQRRILLKQQKKSLEEQSRRYQEKLEQERQEKMELEQSQLKRTIESKELELAKKTIDQMEINEMILSIKKKLEEVQSTATDKLSTTSYQDMINFIDKKINTELFNDYEVAFDNSQAKFHEKLLNAHPHLSSKDLRICSYLMMNLSSKEIAKILNVLPSSIDVGRSRLRKKLNLTEQDSLREYLSKFSM